MKDILRFLKKNPNVANYNRYVKRTWTHLKLEKKDKIINKLIKNIN